MTKIELNLIRNQPLKSDDTIALLKEIDELNALVDSLRNELKYPDPEDMPPEEAAKYCPFKNGMHFHHDGCPSEWAVETRCSNLEKEVDRLRKIESAAEAVVHYYRNPEPETEHWFLKQAVEGKL